VTYENYNQMNSSKRILDLIGRRKMLAKDLKDLLESRYVTSEEVAKKIGVSPQHLNEIVEGRAISDDTESRIWQYFASSLEKWGSMKNRYDLKEASGYIKKAKRQLPSLKRELRAAVRARSRYS